MNVIVSPQPGYYLVTQAGRRGITTHRVSKAKTCTCGGTARRRCPHIRAVEEHLKGGGRRAPESTPVPAVAACPLCSGEVQVLDAHGPRPFWRCKADSSHYWRWRGEMGVKAFLTRPHPNKPGAFYEQTLAQREAFLANAARLMLAGGYSPLG
jgi:hypothetical protein